jgi:predicted anti-sigma-YlaC factor YlaD
MQPVDISCQQFVELVTEYLEGTLPGDLSASIEAHLDICDGCRLYLGQMRLTVRALRANGTDALPAALAARLLAELKQGGGS